MRKFLLFLLVGASMVVLCADIKSETPEKSNQTIHCTWEMIYSDIETMASDSELVLSGQVSRRIYFKDGNEVYSCNHIEIDDVYKGESLEEIDVRQIGGEYGGIVTPFPKGVIPLEKETRYILFLKKAMGENYYYIVGANQGVFEKKDFETVSNLRTIIANYEEDFNSHQLLSEPQNSRIVITPNYGIKWSKAKVYFYMPASSNITSSQLSNLKSGAVAWNSINSKCDMVEASSAKEITVGYSGQQVGIAGLTNLQSSGSTIEYATVTFYYNNLGNGNLVDWKTCAIHEFGHVYGLDHYPGGDTSVMYPNLSDCSTSPQTSDILSMEELYGM